MIVEPTEPIRGITGGWHLTRHYDYATVCGTITGCGLAQISGVTNLCRIPKEDAIKLIEQIKMDYRADGVGGIIATLGCGYYHNEPRLLELGFKLLAEYPNYRHQRLAGNKDTQRVYILTY